MARILLDNSEKRDHRKRLLALMQGSGASIRIATAYVTDSSLFNPDVSRFEL